MLLFMVLCASVLLSGLSMVYAQPSYTMNYQGKLTNNSGLAVADGTYAIEFKLYTQASGGVAIWTETRSGGDEVTVRNGLFSVMLGSVTSLASVNFNQPLYLGVNVESDGEMTPRKALGTVPSAFEAKQLGGVASTSFLRSDVADSASGLLTFTGGLNSTASTSIARFNFTNATGTSLYIGGDRITDFSGTNLAVVGNSLGLSATYLGQTSITTLGTITSGTWNGTAIGTSYLDSSVLLATELDTSAELATLLGDETGTGRAVLSISPAFSGTSTFAALTASSTLTLSGTAANIALGSNYLSGDGGDEGIFVDSDGDVGIGTSTPIALLDIVANNIGDSPNSSRGIFLQNGTKATSGLAQVSPTITWKGWGYDSDLLSVPISMSARAFVQGDTTFTPGSDNYFTIQTAKEGGLYGGSYTDAFVIDAYDKVGLYDTTPSQRLDIDGTNAQMLVEESTTEFFRSGVGETANTSIIGWDDSDSLRLGVYDSPTDTSISSLMTILSTGNVGIGTTSPYTKLSVAGNLAITGGLYDSGASLGTNGMVLLSTGSGVDWVATSTLGLGGSGGGLFSTDIDTSSELAGILGDETGSGALVFGTNPTFTGTQVTFSSLTAARGLFLDASSRATTTATSAYLTNSITDETGSGALVFATSPTFSTSALSPIFSSTAADPADTGVLRLGNAEAIGWEASPTGADVTLSVNASEQFVFTGTGALIPAANDGASLGISGTAFSDLFLASGAVINFVASDVTVTHASNALTFAGASGGYSFDANMILSGTAANIALGSNYLSGDGGDEGIYVDSTGNVGIGTSTPTSRLSISSNSGDSTKHLIFHDADVAHGMTAFTDNNAFLQIKSWDSSAGGAYVSGVSDSATTMGMVLESVIGSTNPSDTIPAMYFSTGRKSGNTYVGLASNETAYQFANTGTNLLTILGSGNVGIGTTTPGALLDVQGAAQFGSGNVNLITAGGLLAGLSSTYVTAGTSANFAGIITDETGTGTLVFGTNPTFTGTQVTFTSLTAARGLFLDASSRATTTATSAYLTNSITDETGSGALVFATSPTLVTPNLGTPSTLVLTNATGLPISTGVSGLGTGIATWLATPSSANLASALTDETGTGRAVLSISPAFSGTPTFAALTASSTLTLSGTAANIALGSNYLSGDGGDEGIYIDSDGDIGIGTTTPGSRLSIAGGNITQTALGNPTLKGTYDTSSSAYDVTVSGKYAYVADYASGLHIIDISNPASPVLEGTYNTSGTADSVTVSGKYAYVADNLAGLHIIDISNPTSPTLVGTYDTSGIAYDITVSGKYAYVADGSSGLHIIDISNPTSPTLVGTYNTSGTADSVTVSGKYAYVADTSSGLHIIDISNPTSPTLVGTYNTSGIAYDITVSGKYAYVADFASGLHIIDVSNPASPTLVGTYNTSGSADSVAVSGKYAYVADTSSGLHVIDISTPASPTLVGTYDTSGNAYDVTVSGKYAYVADDTSGLQIIDLNGAELPTLFAGNIETDLLNVNSNLVVGNDIYTQGGINAGISGIFSRGTIAAFVASTTQTNPMVATFMGGNTGLGTTTSTARLSIQSTGSSDILNLFETSGSEVFTVLESGNVGIGDTSPDDLLNIHSASAESALTITSLGTNTDSLIKFELVDGTATFSMGVDDSDSDKFKISTTGLGTNDRLVIDSSGNVGIGTSTPNSRLTVQGSINISQNNAGLSFMGTRYFYASTTNDSIAIGESAGSNFNSGTGLNVALGYYAGGGITNSASDGNNMIGWNAGYSHTGSVGYNNNIIGSVAGTFNDSFLFANNTGNLNNIIGTSAGGINSGDGNNLIGTGAGFLNDGDNNNFIGNNAGAGSYILFTEYLPQTGSYNNFIGNNVGYYSSGSHNNFTGTNAGFSNTGSYNNLFGYNAGYNNTGSTTVMIGYRTGEYLRASSTVAIGGEALRGTANFVAPNNVAIGQRAGYAATTGAWNNILIGYRAADNLTTGNNNIIIGYDIDNVTATADNRLNIGNLIFGTGLDGTGTTLASGNVGIGTTSPYAKFSVAGNLALTGGLYDSGASLGTNGMVLLSTGSGVDWVATSSLGISGGSGATTFLGLTDTPGSFTAKAIPFVSGGTALDFDSSFVYDGARLGIGSSTPSATLTIVADGTTPRFWVGSATSSLAAISVDGNDQVTLGTGYGHIYFDTAGGTNVGVGTSTPTAQLHTTGSVRFSNFGAGTLTTDANGNLSVSSDERLKHVIGSFGAGMESLRGITPIQYRWNELSGLDQVSVYTGFSAQNVQEFIPDAVGVSPSGMLTISDRPILAAVINATKEQQLSLDVLLATSIDEVWDAMSAQGQYATSTYDFLASSSLAIAEEEDEDDGLTILERTVRLATNFVNGVLKVAGIVTEGLTIGSEEKPAGLTIFDTVTGEPYCLVVESGQPTSIPGACEDIDFDDQATEEENNDESQDTEGSEDIPVVEGPIEPNPEEGGEDSAPPIPPEGEVGGEGSGGEETGGEGDSSGSVL
jgi:hypothetical protein